MNNIIWKISLSTQLNSLDSDDQTKLAEILVYVNSKF